MYLNGLPKFRFHDLRRLTITWDVFEYGLKLTVLAGCGLFNYNMGCI